MSAYKGRTVKNKGNSRRESRFIDQFNKVINSQLQLNEEELEKVREQFNKTIQDGIKSTEISEG